MNHQPNYTHPWHDDEMCRVNGIPLCYRFNFDNEIEVMMPGYGCLLYTSPSPRDH
jgi:hypothetical protein